MPVKSKKKSRWRKSRHWLQYILIRLVTASVCLLPRKWALFFAGTLGRLAFGVLKKDRERTLANLTKVFAKEKTQQEIRSLGRSCFIQLAKNTIDFARLKKTSDAELNALVTCDGAEHLGRVLERGKGVIGLTGHIGNWEMMGAWLCLQGYPLTALARQIPNKHLNSLLIATRKKRGVNTIDRNNSARRILEILRNGGSLGVLLDQDTKVNSTTVSFFGYPAKTPIGLAKLVLKTGASVVPLAMHRRSDDTYHLTVHPPIEIKTAEGKPSPEELTQTFNHALERLIMIDPAQWVWMHRRWKTRK